MRRRQFFLMSGVSLAAASGCGSGNPITETVVAVDDAIATADTADLRSAKLALRGYQLVSFTLGPRVMFLPYPGMRILSVAIVASGLVAKLVVDYIDDELIRRQIEEELTSEVRAQLEADGFVQFKTESGVSEKAYLGPTVY